MFGKKLTFTMLVASMLVQVASSKSSTSIKEVLSSGDSMTDIDSKDDISVENEPEVPQVDAALFHRRAISTRAISGLIVVLGLFTSSAFMSIGMTATHKEQSDQFERRAMDFVNKITGAWGDYVTAAAWIHGRCRNRNFSRSDFRETYEYLVNSGLSFQAAQFDPFVAHAERAEMEQEAREYYAAHYPSVKYRGIVGVEDDVAKKVVSRSEQRFYMPIHYMEPVVGNEAAIDLDYHSYGSRKRTVLSCMQNGKPALTDRLRLVQEQTASSYGVVLMHPGYNITSPHDVWPRDLASIVIRIPDLLRRSADKVGDSAAAYIYDASDSVETEKPLFLGGIEVVSDGTGASPSLTPLPEIELDQLKSRHRLWQVQSVKAANKDWVVIIHALDGTYEPEIFYVICGAVTIFAASVLLACWLYFQTKRDQQFAMMKAKAEAEKAALKIESAREATRTERELNDFIAHEVRNPVAAAMAACSFVKSAVAVDKPLSAKEAIDMTRADVNIIDKSLHFINDLLRNMLDMHRAANSQLKVDMMPTDMWLDVLEPVHAMLPHRDSQFKVTVDCPEGIVALADRLRLKQVIINLGRNSLKFIQKGFIRLSAEVKDGNVRLIVEDSGPGIPKSKLDRLFAKYQESLDTLSQGTGIGLYLCKNLVELMGGEIILDEDYDSGVKGNPGTRFIVDLKQPAMDVTKFIQEEEPPSAESTTTGTSETSSTSQTDSSSASSIPQELPETLNVLFTDDDPILRKMFNRTLRRVFPEWKVREAANGETALQLIEDNEFDLIFMDMYMASVEKQLLGSETVQEMRIRGVKSRICGLSANDKETEFLESGADIFCMKPFPCQPKAVKEKLLHIMYSSGPSDQDS